MRFNINFANVKIKLNLKGKKMIKDRYERQYIDLKTDKDGYVVISFREFMQIFGETLNANWTLPFDENVEVIWNT